jgi:hypothetical protein
MKKLSRSKLTIVGVIACAVVMVTGVTAFAMNRLMQTDIKSDENGTRYSVDGGVTWTEENPVSPDPDAVEIDVDAYTETITDGGEITDEDMANAIDGGHYEFKDGVTDIDVIVDGEPITEQDKSDAVYGGHYEFKDDATDVEIFTDGAAAEAGSSGAIDGGYFEFDEAHNDISVTAK